MRSVPLTPVDAYGGERGKASQCVQKSSKNLDLLQSCDKNFHPVPSDAVLKTNCTLDLPSIFYILSFWSL